MSNQQPKHIVIDNRIRRASTGRYSDRLVEHLQVIDHDNQYTVLLQPDDPWQPTAPNFKVAYSPYAQFSLNPLEQIGFARQLYKLRADLVHFPMNSQPLLYFKPVVTSTLDLTMLRFTRPGKTPLPIFWIKMLAYRFLFWYSNKKSKAVITISNYVKDDLAEHYPSARAKTFNTYCASEPPLPGQAQPPAGINPPFLLYVGSPFPHKNLPKLVEAFELLAPNYSDLRLVLVGKKEQYYERLEKFVSSTSVAGRVTITGFLPDESLKWLYQNAEAYVFPSLSEGFGLPGLEAMVHGCPVISSNATCLPEIYGDSAHYFDPEDIDDMALKISEVLDNPGLRSDLIKKGSQQVKKYSWRRMAEQTLEVYKQVLGDK